MFCPFDPNTDKQSSLTSNSPMSFSRDCLRSYTSDAYSIYYFYIFSKNCGDKFSSYMFFPFKKVILHMASCAYLPQTGSNILSIQKNSQTTHTAPIKSAPGHLFIVQLRTVLRRDFLHHFGEWPNRAKTIILLLLFVAAVKMYVPQACGPKFA